MTDLPAINRTLGSALLGNEAQLSGLAEGHILHAFAPVNELRGVEAFRTLLLDPLRAAFPRGEERVDIRLRGQPQLIIRHKTKTSTARAAPIECSMFNIKLGGWKPGNSWHEP